MATVAASTWSALTGPLLTPSTEGRARFSREAYHRLAETGVLGSDLRVELIDGEIYMMLPIGPPQGSLISRLTDYLTTRLPKKLQCRVQLPIVVSDHSEPQPDIVVARRREDDYRAGHPIPSDVMLLIEVAQSSLRFDLGRKLELYATSGITEYWVVDIDRKAILVHRDPSGNTYQAVETFAIGSTLAPIAASECVIDLTWLFR